MDLLILTGAVVALLAAHELAHALAARAVGARVARLSVGIGPRLARASVRGIPVELRLVPGFGWCEISEDRPLGAGRHLVIVLAGPAVNLALAMVLLLAGWTAAGGDIFSALGRSAWGLVLAPWALGSAPLADLLPWSEGRAAQLLVVAGLISAAAGWINLIPLAPLDGWRALMELLRAAGFQLQPHQAHRMARVSSAILVGAGAVMVVDTIPRAGGAFVALGTMVGALWLIRLVHRLEQRNKGDAP